MSSFVFKILSGLKCSLFLALQLTVSINVSHGTSLLFGKVLEQRTYFPMNNDLFGSDYFFLEGPMENDTQVMAVFKIKKTGKVYLNTEDWPCLQSGELPR